MKKIVSLVLALVLVLAIAAPAMAITGYEKPTTPTASAVAPYAGGISLIDASAAGLGVLSLNSPASNKAYVANEVVYFRVDLTTPAKTSMAPGDFWDSKLYISSTAASLIGAVMYKIHNSTSSVGTIPVVGWGYVEENKSDIAIDKNTLTIDLDDNCADENEYQPNCNKYIAGAKYVVIGYGVVKAQGEITAEIKGGNMEKFKKLDGQLSTDKYFIYDNLGTLLYAMYLSGNNVVVDVYKAGSVIGTVKFDRDAKYNCTKISVANADTQWAFMEVKYTVPVSYEGAVLESFDTITATNNYHLFNALKAAYEQVMTFFGFDYNAKGLLLDGHFTQMLNSFYANDSVTVNLYTQAITVPDPDVEIPQTGDAATTIGFVMVAMAIVAAAAVAYKKVRA